jgi:hypothetical protein
MADPTLPAEPNQPQGLHLASNSAAEVFEPTDDQVPGLPEPVSTGAMMGPEKRAAGRQAFRHRRIFVTSQP